jgi:hypothetical protein
MKVGYFDQPFDAQGWTQFNNLPRGSGSDYLDASRVCSLPHARRMGWLTSDNDPTASA